MNWVIAVFDDVEQRLAMGLLFCCFMQFYAAQEIRAAAYAEIAALRVCCRADGVAELQPPMLPRVATSYALPCSCCLLASVLLR